MLEEDVFIWQVPPYVERNDRE